MTGSAKSDLFESASFIISDTGNREATNKYLKKIEKGIMSLNEFPELGVIPKYRLLKLQGYRFLIIDSHLIFYKINPLSNEVIIYRIIHNKQSYTSLL
jgi:toxin ParE1/3/4